MKQTSLSAAMTAFMLSLASLTLPSVGDLHAADIFTKVTAGPGSDVGNCWGAAWGDYDNDGYIDLFVAQAGPGGSGSASHFLYHNNTNGTFSRVTNGPVAAVVSAGRGGAWGDYDNDGYLDLVLVNLDQPNYLFHNNGDGSFAAVPNPALVSDLGDARSVIWVDYDNDGYVDLFRTAGSEPRRLYHNNHDETFTRITQGAFLTVPGTFIGGTWGDYNNDGRPDLFLPQANEPSGLPSCLYRNDGGGTFTRVGAPVLNGNFNSIETAWGDYDNDGDLDLFVSCNGSGGISRPNLFYRNDGNGTFTSLTSLPANDPENQGGFSVGCTWGDYDNDGWLDLFVGNRAGQNDFLYHNNGDGTFTKVLDSIAVNDGVDSLATIWGDYDNDGFLDLFVGNFAGTSFLYHNNTNDNHWLKFRLIGTRSNRAAIGAKVRVRATINGQSFWQLREVSGGDGRTGQNSLHVHVGLGNATNADLVRIEWPSGIVQEFLDVAANHALAIQESAVDIFPAQADVSVGATLTLSVTNAPPDSTLQWLHNGADISGATNATLEISSVTTNLNGHYTIVFSNATGMIFPRPAVVRVFDRPVITSQPQSTNVLVGSNVTLNVTAFSPSPITYQWQFNGLDLHLQTNSSLTLTNVQFANDGVYTVVATDALRSVTSEPTLLTVWAKPIIVQAPISQSVVAGGSVTFSVEITGNPAPFLYQWRRGSTIVTNMVLAEKKAFFALNNVQTSNGGQYRVLITNAALPALTLNTTWNLTVLPDADGDGLPDAWEAAHGLNPADAADAELDADGDSQNNLAEYRAGTNPTNAVSYLKLGAVTQLNGTAFVSFNAVSNQTYTVEWCADLGGGTWTKLTDLTARANNRTETVNDGTPSAAARFYRVITPRQP